ncbi:MAG: hypothetical protein ABI723_06560 [Bacteroidia bacterium]
MKQKIVFCFFMLVCFVTQQGIAQQNTIDCDTNNYSVFRKYKGDMIKVECDTIYLLNKFTFDLMFRSYNEFRNQNLLLSQYTTLNDSISGLYETQLDSQRVYFDTLNAYFDKLASNADELVDKSKANLGSISDNLDTIQSQIKDAKENITNAQKDIELAKKQMRKQKWKWAAGGFGIGAVLTLIATLIL